MIQDVHKCTRFSREQRGWEPGKSRTQLARDKVDADELRALIMQRRPVSIFLVVFLVAASFEVSAEGWNLNTSNTGLARLGITCDSLPTYTGPSKPASGTTISMQKITYTELILSNGNITLDRVCVKPTNASGRSSIIFGYNPDTGGNQLGPVTIMDSDIDASGVTDSLVYAVCAFRGAGSLYRNNIWGMGSGICYFNSSTQPTAVIEQNYVHDLRAGMFGNPPQQSHNSSATIRSFNGTSMVWRNNKLISQSGADSGALFIQTYDGTIQNVIVEGNYLDTYGMSWSLPLEAGYGNTYSNMQAINNRFGTSGYGVGYVSGGPGWAVWSNNFIYDSEDPDGRGVVASCPGGACADASDTTPPTTPTGLSATAASATQINLSWTASTDNVGIAGYDIRRCSGSGCTPSSIVHSTTGTGTTWNNTGLSASTIYRYDVRARDAVPNYSDYSTIAQATTQTSADITPPSVTIATADPSNITADSLTVTGAASDAVGVSGCKWRRSLAPNASNGTLCTGTTSFSCATSGYSQGANTLYVGCFDAAGNYGSDSMVVNYYPPLSAPTNLRIY